MAGGSCVVMPGKSFDRSMRPVVAGRVMSADEEALRAHLADQERVLDESSPGWRRTGPSSRSTPSGPV